MNDDPATSVPPAGGESSDFSLVAGGPLYHLYLKWRLARPPLDLTPRRILLFTSIAWLPLLCLSALEGHALGGGLAVPFLQDLETHARFLLALPLLIAADRLVHHRLKPLVDEFQVRGIITPEDRPKFLSAIGTVTRLRDSAALEVGLAIFVLTAGQALWRSRVAFETATWYAVADGAGQHHTLAGQWFALVSIPIFQFILLRWYLRFLLWLGFLWRVAGLNLRLMPTHADRCGGLGFLNESIYAFTPLVFAQATLYSGMIANRIFLAGQSLTAFKTGAIGLVIFCVVIYLAPLSKFFSHLARAKARGLREYGLLVSRYVREFDDKWMRGGAPEGERLMASGDIQSLADIGNSYTVIREMRVVPFGLEAVASLAFAATAPLLPLVLTLIPFGQLVGMLLKILV